MVSYREHVAAPPAIAWERLAEPALWRTWAPHLRGAWRLGGREVEAGRSGAVRVLGALPLPVRITEKEPGRSWTWVAGPYEMRHIVEPRREGSEVRIEVRSSRPLEAALALTYGPLIAVLLRRLARTCARAAATPAA